MQGNFKSKLKAGFNYVSSLFSKVGVRNFLFIIAGITAIVLIDKGCNPDVVVTDKGSVALQPVKHYTDKDGVGHAVIPTNVVSKEVMDFRMDSLAKSLKAKYINQFSEFTGKVDTVFRNIPVYVSADNPDSFNLSQSDQWLTVTATGNTKTKKGNIKVQMYDTLTYVDYTKKGGLFKSDKRYIDISNKNPYNSIQYGANLTLYQPKTLVSIGPSVGYMWSLQNGKVTGKPSVGVSVNLNLIPLIKSKAK